MLMHAGIVNTLLLQVMKYSLVCESCSSCIQADSIRVRSSKTKNTKIGYEILSCNHLHRHCRVERVACKFRPLAAQGRCEDQVLIKIAFKSWGGGMVTHLQIAYAALHAPAFRSLCQMS